MHIIFDLEAERKEIPHFEYPESIGRVAPPLTALLPTVLVTLVYWGLSRSPLGEQVAETQAPGLVLSVLVLPFPLLVGTFMGAAMWWRHKAIESLSLLGSTVDAIACQIGQNISSDYLTQQHYMLVSLLRAIYCKAKNTPFTIKVGGKEYHTYEAILVAWSTGQRSSLVQDLLKGNGALNRFLLAREGLNSVSKVSFSRTIFVGCVVAFVIMEGAIWILLLSLESPWFSLPVVAATSYLGVLMLWVGHDWAHPFGQGAAKLALRERFQRFEDRLSTMRDVMSKE